ncbi:MAG: metal ABC transporter permease [bacterium]|nr:metal ABC transporter permease [bacterium]
MIHTLVERLPLDWLQYEFMQRALCAIILLAPLFAILGCLVINSQMAFFADAIGHSALTGIAVGVLAGLEQPLWAMLLCAIVLAVALAWLRYLQLAPGDALIGLMVSFTVALGVVILSRQGGFQRYTRYLVGDILTITPTDLYWSALLTFAVLLSLGWKYNHIVVMTLHRPLAASRGVRVWATDVLFSTLVAISVTLSIAWMGLLVINSLIILPAASARNLARSAVSYVWLAVVISVTAGVSGVIVSYYLSTATGATIVLCAMALFLLSTLLRR